MSGPCSEGLVQGCHVGELQQPGVHGFQPWQSSSGFPSLHIPTQAVTGSFFQAATAFITVEQKVRVSGLLRCAQHPLEDGPVKMTPPSRTVSQPQSRIPCGTKGLEQAKGGLCARAVLSAQITPREHHLGNVYSDRLEKSPGVMPHVSQEESWYKSGSAEIGCEDFWHVTQSSLLLVPYSALFGIFWP
ncbi:hypothetical protein CB1_000482010 [Camelus ferus]|nr:hypothetical protein CB1_000482010 [Camelus ferus]